MKKAILIGNGFTSNLIEQYKNCNMMQEFRKLNNELYLKANEVFEIFRDLGKKDNEIYEMIEGLFPSETLYPPFYPRADAIKFDDLFKETVLKKLNDVFANDSERILDEYFINYGLAFQINKKEIEGIENLLKVVHMFIGKGLSEKNYEEIKELADIVYYNNGHHGLDDIDSHFCNKAKMSRYIQEFYKVYTTNFDTILDDILEPKGAFPCHLHGGFSISHPNDNPNGRYSPGKAFLVWGISSDEKYKFANTSFKWSTFKFSTFRWGGNSQIGDYFEELSKAKYDEFHIIGFSGENDGHINSRIKENKNINEVIYYTDPKKINDKDEEIRLRILFGEVTIKSWNEFWEIFKK